MVKTSPTDQGQGIVAAQIWKRLFHNERPEQSWLFQPTQPKMQQLTYKDLNAQAHCVAAFLLDRGLQKGEVVGVISDNSAFAITVDLGIQYAGGVVMFIPLTMTDESTVNRILVKNNARFVFVEKAEDYSKAGYFNAIQGKIEGIFLQEDEIDNLPYERLSTYDRIITLGKVLWRENMRHVNARKDSLGMNDIYSILIQKEKEDVTEKISYRKLEQLISQGEEILRESDLTSIGTLEDPSSILQRVYGFFCPLVSGAKSWSLNKDALHFPIKLNPAPKAIFLSPETLVILQNKTGELFAGNNEEKKGRLKKAELLGFTRKEKIQNGGKLSLVQSFNYFLLKKGLFAKVARFFGKSFTTFILDKGKITEESRLFFEDAGFKIVQPQ